MTAEGDGRGNPTERGQATGEPVEAPRIEDKQETHGVEKEDEEVQDRDVEGKDIVHEKRKVLNFKGKF